MNVIRPVVQLHTLEQWLAVGPGVQNLVLANIKLAARLDQWLMKQNNKQKKAFDAPEWVPCRFCNPNNTGTTVCEKCGTEQGKENYKGFILMEPRYPGIHPSQIGSACLLRIYNDAIGLEKFEKIEPRSRRIFDLGHMIHHMFQGYGEKGAWGPSYKKEVDIAEGPLAEDLKLEGHCDADNILPIDDIEDAPIYEVGIVHEYKSINDNNFTKLTRPKPEHKMQATLYMMALNRPVVCYFYMNKNDCNILDYPVGYDPTLWGNIYNKTKTVANYVQAYDDALEAGQPAPAPPKGSPSYDCNQCGYAKMCPDYKAYMDAKKGGK